MPWEIIQGIVKLGELALDAPFVTLCHKARYVFPGGFLSYPGLYCFRYVYIGCEMVGNKRQQTDTCQLLHVVSLWWHLVRFQSVKNAASRPKAENERFIDCPQGGE